jgi:hypothetical protein
MGRDARRAAVRSSERSPAAVDGPTPSAGGEDASAGEDARPDVEAQAAPAADAPDVEDVEDPEEVEEAESAPAAAPPPEEVDVVDGAEEPFALAFVALARESVR